MERNESKSFDFLRRMGPVVKAEDLRGAGISPGAIRRLALEGRIVRLRHGYYRPAGCEVSDEQLLARLVPCGIVCMESALFHYGYSDFVPRAWSIAVPRTVSRTRLSIDGLSVRAYYVKDGLFELGRSTGLFNGVTLPVYDRERTICDAFRCRSSLDAELFGKAVRAYAEDPEKRLPSLLRYAHEMRLEKKIAGTMEVLLNG